MFIGSGQEVEAASIFAGSARPSAVRIRDHIRGRQEGQVCLIEIGRFSFQTAILPGFD
jgi:hypothetical protein